VWSGTIDDFQRIQFPDLSRNPVLNSKSTLGEIADLSPQRNHQFINKRKTWLGSILNSKKEGVIQIHEVEKWTNPDDLTLHKVDVSYHSS
jgi:hypothetical protein